MRRGGREGLTNEGRRRGARAAVSLKARLSPKSADREGRGLSGVGGVWEGGGVVGQPLSRVCPGSVRSRRSHSRINPFTAPTQFPQCPSSLVPDWCVSNPRSLHPQSQTNIPSPGSIHPQPMISKPPNKPPQSQTNLVPKQSSQSQITFSSLRLVTLQSQVIPSSILNQHSQSQMSFPSPR